MSYVASHSCLMFDWLFSASAVCLFLENNKEVTHREHWVFATTYPCKIKLLRAETSLWHDQCHVNRSRLPPRFDEDP